MPNTTNISPYQELLQSIQNYKDSDLQNYPRTAELSPDKTFKIDLDTRTINLPKNQLSVQYDHNSEVVFFECPRYYGNMDLSTTVCIIEYINANEQGSLYWVPYYDIKHYSVLSDGTEEPIIIFPWAIGGLVTAAAGTVKFCIRFYKLSADGSEFQFNMSTEPKEGTVLHGMDITGLSELQALRYQTDIVEQIYEDIALSNTNATTYWIEAV